MVQTTLRSPDRLRAVRNQLLSPIHSALQRWLSEPDSTPEAKMALNVLRCQYELCESAVARFEVHAE